MSRTPGARNRNYHYGPVPVTKYDECVSCSYLGTDYCMYHCPEADEVLQSCDYRCNYCSHRSKCPCAADQLPRLIGLHLDLSALPNPLPTTTFLPKHQSCLVSNRYSTSTWLLCNPRQHAREIIAWFKEEYGYEPDFYAYCNNLGILIAGPIKTN